MRDLAGRVHLRPLRRSDIPARAALLDDPAFRANLNGSGSLTDAPGRQRWFAALLADGRARREFVITSHRGTVLAYTFLEHIDSHAGTCHIAVVVPPGRRAGVGAIAMHKTSQHAAEQLGMSLVISEVNAPNRGMRPDVEQLAAATMRRAGFSSGVPVDVHVVATPAPSDRRHPALPGRRATRLHHPRAASGQPSGRWIVGELVSTWRDARSTSTARTPFLPARRGTDDLVLVGRLGAVGLLDVDHVDGTATLEIRLRPGVPARAVGSVARQAAELAAGPLGLRRLVGGLRVPLPLGLGRTLRDEGWQLEGTVPGVPELDAPACRLVALDLDRRMPDSSSVDPSDGTR